MSDQAHDPAWYVPQGARKAHWFDGQSTVSACRFWLDSERGRLAEFNGDRRCFGCTERKT